jgi:DNA polymerase sigma
VEIGKTQADRDFMTTKLSQLAVNIYSKKEKPVLKLFGSLVTGLALESSDMDLAISGLNIPDREDMIEKLTMMADAIEKWPYKKKLKAITTASIPVIKVDIDIDRMRELEGYEHLETQPGQVLQLDITFDDSDGHSQLTEGPYDYRASSGQKTHLGLESCHLVQSYIRSYPHLREVAMIMKKFMSEFEYNHPYNGKLNVLYLIGGISSYSLVLMMVAYYRQFQPQPALSSPSRILLGFLEFYGQRYSPTHHEINVKEDG